MTRIIVVTACIALSLLTACNRQPRLAASEAPPAKYQASPQETSPVRVVAPAAPKIAEVRDAVDRIFKGAALVDSSRQPSFISGDFNGDSSQDLAVVVKPDPGRLSQLNEDYPAWLVRDPLSQKGPSRTKLQITENESLLAVIHGFGANDWRDPQATQTFVLKNVVGTRMEVSSGQQFLATNSGRKLPQPQGDLIAEVVGGTSGYLYFSSQTYSWYDPKTYNPEAQQHGMVHMPRK